MSVKGKEIIDLIEDMAPVETQEEWDNSGLQIGDINKEIEGLLLVMDITDKSVQYAKRNGLNMIIAHHPFLFTELKTIDFSTYKGKLIKEIIESDILIYSAHTNLDKAELGVNRVLAEKLDLTGIEKFSDYYEDEIGLFGKADYTFKELLEKIKLLGNKNPNIFGEIPESFSKIGVIGGSGSFGIPIAKNLGCDILITSDIKHHDGQLAYEEYICVIDIGHFYSEFPVLSKLEEIIKSKFGKLNIDIFKDPVFFI